MKFNKKLCLPKSDYHKHPEPLTFKKLDSVFQDRIDVISKEFQTGFSFIKNCEECEKSVTFFGSARTHPDDPEYVAAKNLAARIAKELGYSVVTGGGPGIMAAGNCGAKGAGGRSVGFTIKLPMEQTTNICLTDHIDFKYFFTRKVCMTFAVEAYVFFPGGFGTMDELFEILTLVQTNKIKKAPVILFGKDYWNDLDKFIKKQLLKNNKIDSEDIDLYTITDNEDVALEIVKNAPLRDVV